MKKFLSDSVELNGDTIKGETHTVVFESELQTEVFIATSNITGKVRRWIPKRPLKDISDMEKIDIIYYNTGEWQEASDVSHRELFLEGKYLVEIFN
jgi:hypothetical protein